LLHEKNNGAPISQHPLSSQNSGGNISASGLGLRNSPANTSAGAGPGLPHKEPPNRSNSFKAASSNSGSPAPVGHIGIGQKASDLPQSHHLLEMVPEMAHELTENGLFSCDLDDNMNFSWKA
jgi:hypothetical protein